MEKKPTSGMAITSLVTGLIAVISSFVPLINILSFPFVILAIVFGIIGIAQVSKGTKAGKGLAVSGFVLGAIALIVTVVMYTTADADAPSNSSANTSSGQTETQVAEQAESDYAVTIDGCVTTQDYSGAPAAVVTFTFTNNSDRAQSPLSAVHCKAFQNGVQLDTAITPSGDSGKSLNEVKPGGTITFDQSYALEDMSDLTVEVKEFLSFNDAILAEQTYTLS